MEAPLKKKRAYIGEILVSKGVISVSTLDEALSVGKRLHMRVGKVLTEMGYVSEEDIAHALAEQYGTQCVDPANILIDANILKLIPEAFARRYKVIPLLKEGNSLKIAMVDPLDVFAIDEMKRTTRHLIMPVVSTETALINAINRNYGMEGAIEDVAKRIETSGVEFAKGEETHPEMLEKVAHEATIIKLVDMLIGQAVRDGASDIHVEPDEDTLRVRMRIDGILHETSRFSLKLHPAIISRIKIIGDLNIAEKRLPQDGRFFMKAGERDVDVRLSTIPTIYGEKAVMRLLDKAKMILDFKNLTPFPEALDPLNKAIRRPFGMILLTGPTGSGKTTTAYTLVNILNTMDKNIVTVEDPVEYQLKVVNQIQVNPAVGITFANALRHILRQDPDIIVIGEIRDKETAEIAIRAALTGHLLISTVHTNDAIGAVVRLVDMGIEPYLVASAVICIVGQRLVKKICNGCKVSYEPPVGILEELGIPFEGKRTPLFFKGEGCSACKGTGFKGRIAIYEVFSVDKDLRMLLAQKKESSEVLKALKDKGFTPLRTQGIRAVIEGHTTVEEVLLATQMPE